MIKEFFNISILHLKGDKSEVEIKKIEYDATLIKKYLKIMHVIYKFECHRKIGNMVSRDLIHTNTSTNKLQGMVEKIERKLKQEKVVIIIFCKHMIKVLNLELRLNANKITKRLEARP